MPLAQPKLSFFSSLNQLLLTESALSEPPPHIVEMGEAPPGRVVRAVVWKNAAPTFHYRNAHDEAPHTWGNMLYLQLMLAVGVEAVAPHFARQLAAFAPYLLGPPHSSSRQAWEDHVPLPEMYWRRFQSLRRRAHLWMERDDAVLPYLVARYEALADLALWHAGKTRVPHPNTTTVLDMSELAALPGDPRRQRSVTMLDRITTDNSQEVRAIDKMERFGVVTEFDPSAKLYRNYVFVKLSTYVKDVWDLQEGTPVLNFGRGVSAGQPLPDDHKNVAMVMAREWFDRQFAPAGARAYNAVLNALGVSDSDDTHVYYRSRVAAGSQIPRERATHTAKVYTVNPPADLAVALNVRPVRVRAIKSGVYVHPEDLGTSLQALDDTYSAKGSDPESRRKAFKRATCSVGTLKFVKAAVVLECKDDPSFREWFEGVFNKEPDAWVAAHEKVVVAEKRMAGVRTRKKIDFTVEEDREILAVAKVYTPKEVWAELQAQFPHHSLRRVSDRGHLLLALMRRGVKVGVEPVTPDVALKSMGKKKLAKYLRAV